MKMLFSASASLEVEAVRQKLLCVGIACEVRGDTDAEATFPIPSYPELWIKNDNDFQTALRLYKRLGKKSEASPVEMEERCSAWPASPAQANEPLVCG